MFGLGMGELVVIFFIILLLFGAKNLPDMAKALGRSVKDFRKAASDIRESLETDINKPEASPVTGTVVKGEDAKAQNAQISSGTVEADKLS